MENYSFHDFLHKTYLNKIRKTVIFFCACTHTWFKKTKHTVQWYIWKIYDLHDSKKYRLYNIVINILYATEMGNIRNKYRHIIF